MRRRELIIGASAWAIAPARAQLALPVVGWIGAGAAAPNAVFVAGFRAGLADTGFAEGRNVGVDYKWAEGRYDTFAAMAADFVARKVAVIVVDDPNAVPLVMRETSTIPVVFTITGDPAELGLVSSINRPSGNVTGITSLAGPLLAKRMEMIGEIIPPPAPFGLLVNPAPASSRETVAGARAAARFLGRQLVIFEAATEAEIDAAFASASASGVRAVLQGPNAAYVSMRDRIVALALKHRIAMVFGLRETVLAGGLMSYGERRPEAYRNLGRYTGKILSGAKVADLPVLLPTTFALVVNLKTAKAIGLDIPESFLVRADEVIE